MSNCRRAGTENSQTPNPSWPMEILHIIDIILILWMGVGQRDRELTFLWVCQVLWVWQVWQNPWVLRNLWGLRLFFRDWLCNWSSGGQKKCINYVLLGLCVYYCYCCCCCYSFLYCFIKLSLSQPTGFTSCPVQKKWVSGYVALVAGCQVKPQQLAEGRSHKEVKQKYFIFSGYMGEFSFKYDLESYLMNCIWNYELSFYLINLPLQFCIHGLLLIHCPLPFKNEFFIFKVRFQQLAESI